MAAGAAPLKSKSHRRGEKAQRRQTTYNVEAILNHKVTEAGETLYEVQWEGYGREETTWEPATHLEHLLAFEEYTREIHISEPSSTKTKQRHLNVAQPHRRQRGRNETRGTAKEKFKPPSGSWEKQVRKIDVVRVNGSINAYLTWESGDQTIHTLAQVYQRCPQKMLRFYESNITFNPVGKE